MYSKRFYNNNIKTNKTSAERIVSFVESIYKPRSVVDIGSSGGVFLSEFMKFGVEDVLGIDGEWIPDENIVIPNNKFIRTDLSKPLILERKFDLAICLEVLEHLDEESGELILKELTRLSDVVLFSAAIPGQGGTHHINEQWPSFWARKFNDFGFKFIDIRPYLWNDNEILPWYRQNMVIYLNATLYHNFLNNIKDVNLESPLSFIHPDMTYVSLLNVKSSSFFSVPLFHLGTALTRILRTYTIFKQLQKSRVK